MATARRVVLGVLVVGLAVAGVVGWRLVTAEPEDDPVVVDRATSLGPTDDGGQLLRYRDVEVTAPADWVALDTGPCGSTSERWGPQEQDPCVDGPGLWFYASATFDPATGPGAQRVEPTDGWDDGGWGGYVRRGDTAVYVQAADRGTVRGVLRSAEELAG